jgi:hypothetical protein
MIQDSSTVKPRIKEPVNFDFRLKWFLYNRYFQINEAEVVLNWLLFPIKRKTKEYTNFI